MSRYEWERGTIKIPAKEWATFRTGLIKSWNDSQEELLGRAQALHGKLTEAMKGKRGSKRQEALTAAINRLCPDRDDNLGLHSLLLEYKHGEGYSLKGMPKKKDLKILPTSKDAVLSMEEATIILKNETKSVTWSVSENNHARDYAHKHPLAQELFRRLSRITWTRGSGGKIVGNDEYNCDNDDEDGGGNYVTFEFGPDVKKRAPSRPSLGSFGFGRRSW